MDNFRDFLAKIDNQDQQARLEQILQWVLDNYPQFETRIAWNQPMFTDHGTFILGFSVAKKHIAIAPESVAMVAFNDQIEAAGYTHGTNMFRIMSDQEVNYQLLQAIIDFNVADKKDLTSFWRK